MKTKRILALLLAIASAASITACGQDGGTKDTEKSDGTTVSDFVSEEASDTEISDGLPEKNYNGRTFTVATDDYMESDYVSEGETGDIVNDAIYRRNSAIEDRFGVKIEVVSDNYEKMKSRINQMVQAGDDGFDLAAQHACTAGTLAVNGVLMNWYDVPYADLEKPWWSQIANRELSYKNKVIYLAAGDYALSITSDMYAFFFDKVAIEDYGMAADDLYAIVRDGNAMMVPGTFSGAMTYFRDNKNPFGVIPYPKYDEAQTDYYTMSDGSHALLAVPASISDPEFTGIITEALCAESWKNVIPKFYETALKVKLADDNDTSEMIDLIKNGCVFDYGYIYDNGIGFGFTLQNLADTRNRTDIASFYAKREKKVLAANEEMFAKLDALIGD